MDKITSATEDGRVVNTLGAEASLEDINVFVRENIDAWTGKPVIWNVDAFDFSEVSGEDIKTFSLSLVAIAEKRRGDMTAIVAATDLPFGMMKVFTTFAENADIPIAFRVFRSFGSASKWLSDERT